MVKLAIIMKNINDKTLEMSTKRTRRRKLLKIFVFFQNLNLFSDSNYYTTQVEIVREKTITVPQKMLFEPNNNAKSIFQVQEHQNSFVVLSNYH